MVPMRAPSLACLLVSMVACSLILAASVSAQIRIAQGDPMEITTDTPEYCRKLLNRIGELVRLSPQPLPRNAADLTSEGQRMCDHGQTRGGIMRLRTALMLMEKGGGSAYR
jgi:hypothetical protein